MESINMNDDSAYSKYMCPFMSSWDGMKHCSHLCRFYISGLDECVICNYMKRKR